MALEEKKEDVLLCPGGWGTRRGRERAIFVHCQFGRVTLEMLAKFVELLPSAAAAAGVERARGGPLEMMEQVLMGLDCRRARKGTSMALQTDEEQSRCS